MIKKNVCVADRAANNGTQTEEEWPIWFWNWNWNWVLKLKKDKWKPKKIFLTTLNKGN